MQIGRGNESIEGEETQGIRIEHVMRIYITNRGVREERVGAVLSWHVS